MTAQHPWLGSPGARANNQQKGEEDGERGESGEDSLPNRGTHISSKLTDLAENAKQNYLSENKTGERQKELFRRKTIWKEGCSSPYNNGSSI